MNRKLFSCVLIIITLVYLILAFQNWPILLSVLIITIATIKHKIYPIKKELVFFILITFGGAILEILLIKIGSAWTYKNPSFFGLPIWMPLFWGAVGNTVITMYEGFNEI